jgi:hypothetical protein
MTGETQYMVKAKTSQATSAILSLWDDEYVLFQDEDFFACYGSTVYDTIAQVIKVTTKLKKANKTIPFVILGKHLTDYDCSIFEIQFDGKAPHIKAMRGEADCDEEKYAACMAAANEGISNLLADKKAWTFKDAIDGIEDTLSDEELEAYYAEDSDEDLDLQDCFGGYMEMPYEEWVAEVLNDMDEGFEEDWDEEE